MLDTINKTLFNVSLSTHYSNESTALVLSGCKVILSEDIPYSELDELSCYYLNNNDYDCGRIIVELYFNNYFIDPYFEFYIQCVSIRADNNLLCKINKNLKQQTMGNKNYTKITKEGKLSIGIGYFFKSQRECEMLFNCKSFCIEGFVAPKKKNNVYGFMCCVEQNADEWILDEGNTYRINKNISINNLYH